MVGGWRDRVPPRRAVGIDRRSSARAWIYPDLRYYYDWYDVPPPAMPPKPTDGWIKSAVVDQLRANPFTKDAELLVDVKRGVVILQGVVASRLAKRAAGDDAWDTPGVTDVSNQLEVAEGATGEAEPERVAEVMTPDVVALEKSSTLQTAAQAMRDEDVGTVVVTEGGHVTGLVSDRDIVVRAAAAGRDMSATTLGSIESKDVKTVAPQDPVERAVGVMRDHAIRRVVGCGRGRQAGGRGVDRRPRQASRPRFCPRGHQLGAVMMRPSFGR